MAFDFNGSKRPSTPSSNSSRKDIDYTSMDSDSGSSIRGSSGFGGFSDRPSGFGGQSSGFGDSPRETPSRQNGFQDRPSGGFSNRPERNDSDSNTSLRPARNVPARTAPRPPAKRPATQRGGSGGYSNIPWRIVLPAIGIVIAVILCVVFREAITEFLAQVLAWVIIVLVIIFLIKWFLFGGKRR